MVNSNKPFLDLLEEERMRKGRAIARAQADVIAAAKRFDKCATEFEGNLSYCAEHGNALHDAVVELEKLGG